jgi:VanZ family protein
VRNAPVKLPRLWGYSGFLAWQPKWPLASAAGASLAIAGLFVLLLLPLPLAFSRDPLYAALENLAHGPLFAGVAFLTLRQLRTPALKNYGAAAVLSCGLAISTELVQSLFARDSAWADVRTDVAGAILGITLWALCFDGAAKTRAGRAALIAAAGLAAICVLAPALRPIEAWIDRTQRFPVLFDASFSQWWTMTESMAGEQDVDIRVRDGALHVRLLGGERPGVAVTKFTADWRAYEALVVDLENPGTQELPLVLHVRDWRTNFDDGDRFLTRRTLRPGERTKLRYTLSEIESGPADRRMRMNELLNIAIYRAGDGADELVVHSIRLE